MGYLGPHFLYIKGRIIQFVRTWEEIGIIVMQIDNDIHSAVVAIVHHFFHLSHPLGINSVGRYPLLLVCVPHDTGTRMALNPAAFTESINAGLSLDFPSWFRCHT